MKVTVLNGNPDPHSIHFDQFLHDLVETLQVGGHHTQLLPLREMDIKQCLGCWGCWVKTPGECVIADDSPMICRNFIRSDFVLFASPIIMGYTSALLKRAHDRLIPLLHPYLMVYQDELHHVSRYEKYPMMGLLLERDKDTDNEDVQIITDIYARDAINFKTQLLFTKVVNDTSVAEVAHAIDSI
jgi:multimeric flavodoxin WrbA